jgi:uncharacterized protein involved in type VI secretion and phage assembly
MSMVEVAPREAAVEAGGYVKGVAIGVVTQNRDPDKLCRVKVSYPWHDQPRESYWARLAMPMAGKGRGLVLIPEVGDEVLVAFERGDLRFPCIVGALWNGKDTPPEANADGNNDKRLFKSRKGHQLLFDDNKSKGVVELGLSDGSSVQKKVTLDDDGIRLDDGAGNKVSIDSRGGTITIEAAKSVTIKAPQITLEANSTAEVKAGSTLTLRGSMVNIN